MHREAHEWVSRWATTAPITILDIGGRNINGTVRSLFPHADYTSLDIAAGDGVDVVADAATWTPDRTYDLVVCCEVFEHTAAWPEICATAYAALRPGGRLIATMAGPGRAPHSAADGGDLQPGEYYANVRPETLRVTLIAHGFTGVAVDYQPGPADVRAIAVRPEVA